MAKIMSKPVVPESSTMPFKVESGYEPLAAVLQAALDQAQNGKGNKCHANGKPFLSQPIMTESRELGAGFVVGQSRKKILESFNCSDHDRAVEDLLGAIVYVAANVILRREHQNGQNAV